MSKIAARKYNKILRRKKRKIEKRLKRKQWEDQKHPMFTAKNIHYEIAEKSQAIACGWYRRNPSNGNKKWIGKRDRRES